MIIHRPLSLCPIGALLIVGLLAGWAGCATPPAAGNAAPRSTMSRSNALAIAKLVAASTGGQVYAIAPTGSMRPTLDEGSVVITEVVGLEKLQKGDIVIYRNSAGAEVIHRLYSRHGDRWFVLGDNNSAIDRETVTPDNLLGRVCGIFYTAAGSKPAGRAEYSRARTVLAEAH